MKNRDATKTRRPTTTASQSSFNHALSAIGSDPFTAISDIVLPQPQSEKYPSGSYESPDLHRSGNNTTERQSHRISLLAAGPQRPSREVGGMRRIRSGDVLFPARITRAGPG